MSKRFSGEPLLLATILLLCGTATQLEADVCPYSITDLGTLGGDASAASDINDAGDVVGWSQTENGMRHAFLYKTGEIIDLGTLPGGMHSEATAINNSGQVVGISRINQYGPKFNEFDQGFIWEQGSIQSLDALYCPCSFNRRYGVTAAYDIDDTNRLVGWSETVRGLRVQHAVLWQDGAIRDIGGGAGDWSISRAFGTNHNGYIVGDFAQDAGKLVTFERRAVLWLTGSRQDLGTLADYGSSTALAINSKDQVVGWSGSFDGSITRPFLWELGEMRDIGTLPDDIGGRALDINDTGYIVGWSGAPDSSKSRAVLWWHGVIVDLNRLAGVRPEWILSEATAINVRRQIVGTGLYNGRQRGFLLTPKYCQEKENTAPKCVFPKTGTVGDSAPRYSDI